MQKINLLLVSLLLSVIVSAQNTNSEQATVQQTIQNLFAALSSMDSAGLRLHSTADVHFYEYGKVWTIDTLIQKLLQSKSITDFKRSNKFDFINTTIKKQTAWVTYYLHSFITINGKEDTINWMETVVLLKEKGRWKVNLLHSTRLSKSKA